MHYNPDWQINHQLSVTTFQTNQENTSWAWNHNSHNWYLIVDMILCKSLWSRFVLSSITDKTFTFPLLPTRLLPFLYYRQTFTFPLLPSRLLPFLYYWQNFYLSSITDKIFYLSSITDKTFTFPLLLTRLLPLLYYRQDFYLSSITDKTFTVPL